MPWKIVLASDPLSSEALHFFKLVVRIGSGDERQYRLPPRAYLQIVAATNFKQRGRCWSTTTPIGSTTPSGERPTGSSTTRASSSSWGDGAADVKPVAGLYKTQIFALARHLGVIEEILLREPTTDTYSLEQSQEDFYYSLHYSKLDLVLWAKNHGVSAESVAVELGYTPDQVRRVYDDIDQKRRATGHLHAAPILLEPVEEVAGQAPLATQIFPTSA